MSDMDEAFKRAADMLPPPRLLTPEEQRQYNQAIAPLYADIPPAAPVLEDGPATERHAAKNGILAELILERAELLARVSSLEHALREARAEIKRLTDEYEPEVTEAQRADFERRRLAHNARVRAASLTQETDE